MSEPQSSTQPLRLLCICTFEKGQRFLTQAAELGAHVQLLTVNKLRHAAWPFQVLEEFHTMPEGLGDAQIINTVTYLARTRRFDTIVALDEFDVRIGALLREHMRLPGMGLTAIAPFRDKLAMRTEAARAGFPVPAFTPVINHEQIAHFLATTPGPWVLKPRAEASAIGIRKIREEAELWRQLAELGDAQSHYVLEQFVPGEIFHVDSLTHQGVVVFTSVSKYGKPPMQTMHEGGVFSTRILDRSSQASRELLGLNARLVPALGMEDGVTHAEYIRTHDGRTLFLEAAARVGGAFIADVIEAGTGVNLWAEWAKIVIHGLRNEPYHVPPARNDYAGSVLCLARQAEPNTDGFNDPEIVERLRKHHHAGLILRSPDPERIRTLLEEYSLRFAEQYLAVAPPPATVAQ